jgi:hypothetical protein
MEFTIRSTTLERIILRDTGAVSRGKASQSQLVMPLTTQREQRYKRPVSSKMTRIKRSNPNPPLG